MGNLSVLIVESIMLSHKKRRQGSLYFTCYTLEGRSQNGRKTGMCGLFLLVLDTMVVKEGLSDGNSLGWFAIGRPIDDYNWSVSTTSRNGIRSFTSCNILWNSSGQSIKARRKLPGLTTSFNTLHPSMQMPCFDFIRQTNYWIFTTWHCFVNLILSAFHRQENQNPSRKPNNYLTQNPCFSYTDRNPADLSFVLCCLSC